MAIKTNDVLNVLQEAELTFIDYGNQETVPFSDIRPLDPKFRSLPAQSHEAKLSFLKLVGPESEYYSEAVDRFRSLCEGRKLVCIALMSFHRLVGTECFLALRLQTLTTKRATYHISA